MYKLKEFQYKASEISTITKCDIKGKDIVVNNVQQLQNVNKDSMSLCYYEKREVLRDIKELCLIFCKAETVIENENITYIITENPKLTFFKFIHDYLVVETEYWHSEVISEISDKYPEVMFGYNIRIGKNIMIAPGTKIGSNCIIGNNVVIRSNVKIGDGCVIKDNSIIGSEGFGYMLADEGLMHIPQIGEILIGNNVTIGSNCTIEKPALGATIIGDNVKIDDLVQIGHNLEIGENTIITTGFKAEGNVKIGKNTFLGMGVTIVSKKVSIGNNCLIGAGTVVTKLIPDNKVVYNKQNLVLEDVGNKLENILKTKKS